MVINILRHGKPDLPCWERIGSSEMGEWINSYNSSSVMHEERSCIQSFDGVPEDVFVVCSDLSRSIHSAKVIGYNNISVIDSVFREAELPELYIPLIKMKPHTWSMVFRIFWYFGVSLNVEPIKSFKLRVSSAVKALIKYAEGHEEILFIGHGIINRFIARELISCGWQRDPVSESNKHLGYNYWEYEKYNKDN
ncbi:MAG: histidine phosphatase family protein [Gammaproteobacteria bacterium]|nr:histidine phosphatase family protein [Gammaproteobacteria bacterium]